MSEGGRGGGGRGDGSYSEGQFPSVVCLSEDGKELEESDLEGKEGGREGGRGRGRGRGRIGRRKEGGREGKARQLSQLHHTSTPTPPAHLALVMVDSQVLPPPLDRGEGTHGHSVDGVGGEQLPEQLALFALETETNILKGSFLRAKRGRLERKEGRRKEGGGRRRGGEGGRREEGGGRRRGGEEGRRGGGEVGRWGGGDKKGG